MAKKLFRRLLPDVHTVRTHKSLRTVAHFLHEPNLWHLNRRSVAGGAAVGLFWAFIPMPFQMLPAAVFSLLFRVNLPIAVAGVWLTNPLTWVPIYYFCYRIGAWTLGTPPRTLPAEVSWEWFMSRLDYFWQPLLLGCVIVGAMSAAAGYFGVRLLWRWHVIRDWEKRRQRVTSASARRPRA
jgi:uncharacterized protein (DUF2062 family)